MMTDRPLSMAELEELLGASLEFQEFACKILQAQRELLETLLFTKPPRRTSRAIFREMIKGCEELLEAGGTYREIIEEQGVKQ